MTNPIKEFNMKVANVAILANRSKKLPKSTPNWSSNAEFAFLCCFLTMFFFFILIFGYAHGYILPDRLQFFIMISPGQKTSMKSMAICTLRKLLILHLKETLKTSV